jgi:membrane-bound ClpP family serine protease
MMISTHNRDAPRPARFSAGEMLVGLAVLLGGSLILAGEPSPQVDKTGDPSAAPAKGEPAERFGWTIKLRLPIDGETYRRAQRFVLEAQNRASKTGRQPVLIFEFKVMPNQSEFGRGTEFGAAYQLADLLSGPKLGEAVTVAYIPQSIQGHAVLVALACDEIIMAPDAQIGSAGIDEAAITDTIRFAYEEIADRHKDVPGEVAMALVDKNLEVLKVETEQSTEYVSRAGLEELKKRRSIQGEPEVLIGAGQPAEFSGREARQDGFVAYLAEDSLALARALDLEPKAIQADPSLGDEWRAIRVDLVGPVNAKAADDVQLLIEDAIRRGKVNFVCLWIDSVGGSLADSARLASFLAMDLDSSAVRTVAYIPDRALADAALVALACDQVVMSPRALLGGEGASLFSASDVDQVEETIRGAIGPAKARSWSLPVALIDPELEVFRCTKLGAMKYSEYFCAEELAQQPDAQRWEKGERITVPGEPLQVNGREALEYWLANHAAENFAEFKQLYGLENDPDLLEPGWADFLIKQLASPHLSGMLLLIGFLALYVELQAPGMGIGGFVAAVCFVLFFWSHYLGGTAGWLEVMLFVAGVSFMLLEVFVLPGFGIFGLGGGVMMIASIILASQTFVLPGNNYQFAQLQSSLLVLTGAGAGAITAALLIGRWLPQLPAPASPLETGTHGAMATYDDLIGSRGVTSTQLTPSGKARVEGHLLDVIADCEVIERGTEIEIVEVHGNRVFVRAVERLS